MNWPLGGAITTVDVGSELERMILETFVSFVNLSNSTCWNLNNYSWTFFFVNEIGGVLDNKVRTIGGLSPFP